MQAVRTQWRGTGFGVIGLDYNAVYAKTDHMDIELTPCVMNNIRGMEIIELNRMNKLEHRGIASE